MKRGGKITRTMKAIKAEQKVLAEYKRLVESAVQESETALKERIAEIKVQRNGMLERIREGEKRDAEAKKDKESQAAGSDETGGSPGQKGNEPERSTKSGVEGEGQETQE